MPQDAFTLKYLCAELNTLLGGGKINRIVEPDNDRVVFTVYTGRTTLKLLLDVNPGSPRIGIIDKEGDSPLTAPNFCMLLRKHLLNATIDGIELLGFDRIVKIDLTPSTEFFDDKQKTLYVELMGRYSNIILTQDGKILGGNRGVNVLGDFVRPLIVGKPYVLPPSNEKLLPSDKSLIDYFSSCDSEDYARSIANGVQGLAVDTAKEMVVGFNKDINQNPSEFFEYLNNFIYNAKPNPCVSIIDGEVKDVFVFPYTINNNPLKSFDHLYLAEQFYYLERAKLKTFKALFDRLNSIVGTALKKAKKRLNAICLKEKDANGLEENRLKGELIMANIYRIKQGDSQIIADNYYDGSKLKIELNPLLPPQKNAENYYKKYNKQKRALQSIIPQKEMALAEFDYLTSVSDYVTLAKTITDLTLIRDELKSYGLIKEEETRRKEKPEHNSYRVYDVKGFTVKVGRNNTENDKLTFTARAESVWLHAKDYHSSHAIIEYNGKQPPSEVVVIASEICAYYSKGRNGGKVEIVYTPKKNVKKPPHSKPGFVTYTNYSSILVNPSEHAELLKTD